MIRNIVIEREFGSGGGAIAQKLAQRLGWKLWDREVTEEIARRLHCDVKTVEQREERCDTGFYRLVKAFMRGSNEASFSGGNLELLDGEHLAEIFEQISLDIAQQGNAVIVGRGATWFLRGRDDTFTVFIFAPREEKIQRLGLAMQRSREEAEELIESVDRERAAFVKRYYGLNWPLRSLYHLMLNSKVGDDLVIETMLGEIERLNGKQTPER
ncbi:MAG: AAA family ATPase [Bryobacteraceae bacterium]